MEVFSALSSLSLFRGIDPGAVPGILKAAGARIERCVKGRLVRMRGDLYDRLILVAQGCLEARFEESDGRSMAIEEFRAPAAVAAAVLVSSDPMLPVSLVAGDDSVLVTIEAEAVFGMMTAHPSVMKAYLEDTGDKVRFLAEKLRLMRFGSLRQRLAGHLLDLSSEQGTEEPRWRYGRERTAELLGAARPSLSREIALMAEDGFLDPIDRHRVRLSIPRLKAIIEE